MSFVLDDRYKPLPVGSVPNDYRDKPGRWNGAPTNRERKPIPGALLDALRDAAQRKGKPMTDAERDAVQKQFQ